MLADLRQAIRGLRRSPGFAIAALLSLALAIGADTAIFSVANAILLRPLPYPDAGRLAILWNRSPGLNIAQDWFSTAQYFDILNQHHGFEQLAIAIGGDYNLTGMGDPERIGVIRVSSNLLPMLGARTARGRLFEAAEDRAGVQPVALLTYGAWTRRFGARPDAVGRTLTLNGQVYPIAGVLARDFELPREVLPTLGTTQDTEVFLTLPLAASAATVRTHEDYNILGRLKPSTTRAAAQAEMDALTARLRAEYPQYYPPNGGLTFSVVPLREQVVGDSRRPLWILSAAVGCVLLIACANLANLLLARALGRTREMALRAALGAGRSRLVRQMLTESVVLSLGGGLAGLLLAAWSLRTIRALAPASVPRVASAGIDFLVLGFAFGLSLAAGIVFGLAPALRASHLDPQAGLKAGGHGASASGALWGRGNRMRRLLAGCELALSVVLLIGAGLLLRSFARLLEVPPGFNPKGVLTMGLTMSGRRYTNVQAARDAYLELWERLDRLPGAAAAGGVSSLPLSRMFAWGPIVIEGRTPPAGEEFINADMRMAASHYFQAMQIPLKRGRFFDEHDTPTAPRVALIDERMAHDYWPAVDPVGRRFHLVGAPADQWVTVVGVVGRVKHSSLDADDRIALYLPQTQFGTRELRIVIRSAGTEPRTLAEAVRREVRAVDPDLPIYQVRTMEDRVAESLEARRFALVLLSGFALLALALAATGIYGVMSYLVTQGSREIGIRMALGATGGGVLRMVLAREISVAMGGLSVGVAAAFGLTRWMESLLYGVSASDALTFTAASGVLLVVAAVACWLPARRASRVDPLVSLRME